MHELHMHNLYACPSDETNNTWTIEHPFSPLSLSTYYEANKSIQYQEIFAYVWKLYTLTSTHGSVDSLSWQTRPRQCLKINQSWTNPIFDTDRIHNQTDNPPSDAYIYRLNRDQWQKIALNSVFYLPDSLIMEKFPPWVIPFFSCCSLILDLQDDEVTQSELIKSIDLPICSQS